jgi:hypothetical protein
LELPGNKSILTEIEEFMSDDRSETSLEASEKEKKKMTPEKWAELRTLAEVDGVRGSELARRYGISAAAVSKHFTEHGVTVGSKKKIVEEAATEKAAEKIAEVIAEFHIKRKQRITETKVQHYSWATQIAADAMTLRAESKKTGKPIGLFDRDFKALQRLMSIVEHARVERLIVLDAKDEINENELPEIQIRDLSDERIKEMRERDESEDADGLGIMSLEDAVELEDEIVVDH